jgi:hypothetical protein
VAVVVLLAPGCWVADVGLEGKACPCAPGWRCEPDLAQCVAGLAPLDSASGSDALLDGGSGADGPEVPEDVWTAADWRVEVYRDLTADFPFVEQEFLDQEWSSNEPTKLTLLDAPFAPGLAVLAGRHVLALGVAGDVVAHDFTPPAINGVGPDSLVDAVVIPSFEGGGARLLAGAASWNGGDGVYVIDTDWSLVRLNAKNNIDAVAADPAGRFGQTQVAQLLYSGWDTGIWRYPSDVQVVTRHCLSMRLLPNGSVLCRAPTTDTETALLEVSSSGSEREVLPAATTELSVVPGSTPQLDAYAYLLLANRDFVAITAEGTTTQIASSSDTNWRWTSALIVSPDHPLGGARGAVYVLESNRTLNRDRVLVLWPP